MPTMKQVNDQIEKLPSSARYIFGTKKEVRKLPSILENNEHIRALTSGYVGSNTWLLVCTDRRIIFLDRGWLYGLKQIQMPLNRINSIDHEIGMAMGSISVWDGATRMTVNNIIRNKVDAFVKIAKQSMEEYNYRVAQYQQQRMQQQQPQQQQPAPQPQQAPQPQPAAELTPQQKAQRMSQLSEHLEKLAVLRDKGILTEEEFQEQKTKMLL
ncbi:MAG: PH domain-containing protein [Alphaproteobacteria bacterium]|nr:PH domain-containing protein [Alphaproteobacteria bacterium]